ncbi:hypothetical protein C8J57DRAFT_1523748 [Mycena rebaudengoi]|nr:hypothetical protein C8J57DRAFT_1523748 [Mycena rebaudengoi]
MCQSLLARYVTSSISHRPCPALHRVRVRRLLLTIAQSNPGVNNPPENPHPFKPQGSPFIRGDASHVDAPRSAPPPPVIDIIYVPALLDQATITIAAARRPLFCMDVSPTLQTVLSTALPRPPAMRRLTAAVHCSRSTPRVAPRKLTVPHISVALSNTPVRSRRRPILDKTSLASYSVYISPIPSPARVHTNPALSVIFSVADKMRGSLARNIQGLPIITLIATAQAPRSPWLDILSYILVRALSPNHLPEALPAAVRGLTRPISTTQ